MTTLEQIAADELLGRLSHTQAVQARAVAEPGITPRGQRCRCTCHDVDVTPVPAGVVGFAVGGRRFTGPAGSAHGAPDWRGE